MRKITTSTGFSVDFDEQNANDMRVLRHIRAIVDPEVSPLQRTAALVDLPVLLLGEKQTNALYDHLGNLNDGRVPPVELERELTEILQGGGDAVKN